LQVQQAQTVLPDLKDQRERQGQRVQQALQVQPERLDRKDQQEG
jgi:hypothetical protein